MEHWELTRKVETLKTFQITLNFTPKPCCWIKHNERENNQEKDRLPPLSDVPTHLLFLIHGKHKAGGFNKIK